MAKAGVKKRWFLIIAPKLFKNREIGETPALEPKKLIGRTLVVNMATLVEDMRKQNAEVSVVIDKVEGDKAHTSFLGIRMLPTSLKRMVRKGRTKLDVSVKAFTKDEKPVTLKVLLITRNIVKGSVSSALRYEATSHLIKRISDAKYDDLSEAIVFERLSKELFVKLKKVYPLKTCQILAFKHERFLTAVQIRKIKDILKKEKARPATKTEKTEPEVKEEEKSSVGLKE